MDLIWTDAPTLATAVRNRTVSPVEVVENILAHIERLQPTINAFITVAGEQARAEARHAEATVLAGEPLGPLHGVPFSVKDLVATAGLRTTMGSVISASHVPDTDAVAVSRLRRAGGILIGKTTTSEYGHKPFTDSPLFGVTRNPWNLQRTAGGSSGGAAAAVASGQAPLAIGTDGGGSVRIPASCCGVVGFKATLGRIPNPDAPDLFATLAHTGPIARTVAEVRLAFEILSDPDEGDPYSQPPKPSDNGALPPLSSLRLAWLPKVGNRLIDGEVLHNTERVVRQLERDGATIETVEVDWAKYEEALLIFVHSRMRATVGHHLTEFGDRVAPSLCESVRRGGALSGVDYQRALIRRSSLFREVQELFKRFDFLLTPTLSRTAPSAEDDELGPITIDGQIAGSVRGAWYPYTFPFNFSGHPAVSVPCGLTSEQMPVGLQIVGRWNADRQLLSLAEKVEEDHGFLRPPLGER